MYIFGHICTAYVLVYVMIMTLTAPWYVLILMLPSLVWQISIIK